MKSLFKALSIITISFLSTSLIVACGSKDSTKANLRRHISGKTKVQNGLEGKPAQEASGTVAVEEGNSNDDTTVEVVEGETTPDASGNASVETTEASANVSTESSDENQVNPIRVATDASAQQSCSNFKADIEQRLAEANGEEISYDSLLALTDSYELDTLRTYVEVKNIDNKEDAVDSLYGVIQSTLVSNNDVLSLENVRSASTGVLCQSAQITKTQFSVELSVPNHLGANLRSEAKQRTHVFSVSDATSEPTATVTLQDLLADQDPLIDLPIAADFKVIKVSNEQGEHLLVFSSFEEAEEKVVTQVEGDTDMTHVKYWVLLKYNKVQAPAADSANQ